MGLSAGRRESLVSTALFFMLPVILIGIRRRKVKGTSAPLAVITWEDYEFLARAHDLRCRLNPPPQSRFRVVALFVLDDGSTIYGTNTEPCGPFIGGAICAERAALLQLRMHNEEASSSRDSSGDVRVRTIYICTDASERVAPGMLCREFLYGSMPQIHPKTTRIVLQSCDPQATPQVHSLEELYPYPSMFTGKTVEEQVAAVCRNTKDHPERYQPEVLRRLEALSLPAALGGKSDYLQKLYRAACRAAQEDQRTTVHPIGYGAAAAAVFDNNDDIRILTASQKKALEYGSTLDAVTQLAPQICPLLDDSTTTTSTACPLLALVVVQVDHTGHIHAPFASARALLVEHHHAKTTTSIYCLVTNKKDDDDDDDDHEILLVSAADLAPLVPVFR